MKTTAGRFLLYTSAVAILVAVPRAIDENREWVDAMTNRVATALPSIQLDHLASLGDRKASGAPAAPAQAPAAAQGAPGPLVAEPAAPTVPEACARAKAGQGRAVSGDRIQLRLFETATSAAADPLNARELAFERLDLGGTYEVDDVGQFGIPLLGRVDALGHTLPCIEAAVALRFFEASRGKVSVSAIFASRPPVTVAGAVRSPGTYAATPGMSLETLLAAAGARTGDVAGSSGESMDMIDRRAALERLALGLSLSIGRLEAESARRPEIALDGPVMRQILASLGERRVATETEMLRARLATDMAAAAASRAVLAAYDDRIAEADSRLAEIARQASRRGDRFIEFAGLERRGVAPASRVEEIEFSAMALERERLAALAELTRLRAEQDVEKHRAELAAAERSERRQAELMDLLQQKQSVDSDMAMLDGQLDRFSGRALAGGSRAPFVSIRRMTPEGPVELAGDPSMPILPGDLVVAGIRAAEAVAASEPATVTTGDAQLTQVTR